VDRLRTLEQHRDSPRPTSEDPASAPRALRATIPATTRIPQRLWLRKDVELEQATRLEYTYQLRVIQPNTTTGVLRLGGVSWGEDGDSFIDAIFDMVGDEVRATLVQVGGDKFTGTSKRLSPGTWYRLKIVLSFASAKNATIEHYVDDERIQQRSFVPTTVPRGRVQLWVGAFAAGASFTETIVDWDDVTFDAK
jgi:hypothetical protein